MVRAQAEILQSQSEVLRSQAETVRTQAEMARSLTHMNEVVAAMADTHKHTEEKLDAFIGVLERYINSNKNGNDSENGDS
jgi:hypothetical protein